MGEEERKEKHQEPKITKLAWKVVIISLVILAVSMYYLSSWIPMFPVYCGRFTDWWEEKTGPTSEEWRAKWRAKRLALIENGPKPKLTGKEVADLLKKEQTIKTQELYDMTDWYVYHGNRDVIKQVFANRQFEILRRTQTKENGKHPNIISGVIGGKYLGPSWSTDFERLIRRQEIHKYAADPNTDPYFIGYLINMRPTFKTDEYRDYYGHLLFYDDILAYLRIYVNYKDWPAIQSYCKNNIIKYPCGWCNWDTIDEVLKIAEEQGVEPAYELYMERYRSNYQKFSSVVRDLNEWKKKIYKSYEYESVFQGWSSENMNAEMRVYNVDSNEAIIGIKNVEKIISVSRNGEDITHLCHVTTKNVMTIPLKAADVIELKYRVNVCPLWWDYYHAKPLQVTTYTQSK